MGALTSGMDYFTPRWTKEGQQDHTWSACQRQTTF